MRCILDYCDIVFVPHNSQTGRIGVDLTVEPDYRALRYSLSKFSSKESLGVGVHRQLSLGT